MIRLTSRKKTKCSSTDSDKNKKDIQSFFYSVTRQATRKPENKKPKTTNVRTIDWILDSGLLALFFFF